MAAQPIQNSLNVSRDITKLRIDTPGVCHVVHLNNAGCSLPPQPVVDAVRDYATLEALFGGYEVADAQTQALDRSYTALGSLLACDPTEIAIVQSATSAWQQAFWGFEFKQGDRILTSPAEYGSNYIAYLQAQKRFGVEIEVIPENECGDLDLEELERLIKKGAKPKLITISHVPTSSGRVYDACGVGRLAKEYGVPYLLDACQSVGHLPVDVNDIQCNFLAGTSRKYLRGPRGAGFLYISKSDLADFEPMCVDVRGGRWHKRDEYLMDVGARRFEQYEMSFGAKLGLGIAVDYALELGVDWIWDQVRDLADHLRMKLMEVEGVRVHDKGRILCGIVSFTLDGLEPNFIRDALRDMRINVSISSVSSTRLDFENRNLGDVLRASVHYYNTREEIDKFVEALASLCRGK